jgi:hypothetical protein
MYAVLFVLEDPDKLDAILDAWYALGIGGATIFESSGLHRRRNMRQNIPIRYVFPQRASTQEGNLTVYTVLPDADMVDDCLDAVERIVGSLDLPGTGIFTAWPLTVSRGVQKQPRGQAKQ